MSAATVRVGRLEINTIYQRAGVREPGGGLRLVPLSPSEWKIIARLAAAPPDGAAAVDLLQVLPRSRKDRWATLATHITRLNKRLAEHGAAAAIERYANGRCALVAREVA